jgi:DHA1 family tetracycline resistance protein-like MFS transporter
MAVENVDGIRAWTKKVSFLVLMLITVIDYVGIGFVYPIFSHMLFKKDGSFLPATASDMERGFYLGLLLSLLSLAQFFCGPLLGKLSDRIGRRKVLLVSLMIGTAGYLISLWGILQVSITLLLLSRLVIGASAGNAAVIQASIADISRPEEKSKSFGLYNMSLGIGLALGPFLGGVLSNPNLFHEKALTLPFWVGTLSCLTSLILVALFFPETRVAKPDEGPTSIMSGIYDLKKIFQMKGIRILMLSIFFFVFGWSYYFEFISVYLINQFDFHAEHIGYFYGYSAAWYALSTGVLIFPAIRRFRSEKVLFYSLALTGGYIFLFLTINNSALLWLYLPILIYLVSLVFPTATAMVSNWASPEKQGEALGIFQSVQSLGWCVAPMLSGSLIGVHHNMPILIGGSLILMAGLIYGYTHRRNLFWNE